MTSVIVNERHQIKQAELRMHDIQLSGSVWHTGNSHI